VTTLGIIALLGPTASGKSDLALRLARWLEQRGQAAEIVSADSMLVYLGMDIGTAKPSRADRAEIRHHLIDIMEITETASVAQFQRLARASLADCQARGVQPIVVGGSALYLRAILDRFDFPGQDPALRAQLEAELAAVGPILLHQRLRQLDPAAAAAILPGNGRRIVRALEVATTTGAFRSRLPAPTYALRDVVQVGLDLPRARLDERVAARSQAMWQTGLIDEVRALTGRGLRTAPTASRAIGYRQAIDYLDGRITGAEAQDLTTLKTRQFARKQLAWWRRDPRIAWRPAEPAPEPAAVAHLAPWLASVTAAV
jgi:tRNA dimethylallyltransferase